MSDPHRDRPEPQGAFALKRGANVGPYVVLEELGRGGMGIVYSAYHPKLRREVAIKILHDVGRGDDASLRRQQRLTWEAQAAAQLSHPNVVSIYDSGEEGGQKYFVMELLRGGTLRTWMSAAKRPWREVVTLFIDVARGLGAAHAAGFIHRDFKPDNVLLDDENRPKVADFGLVRRASPSQPPKETAAANRNLEGGRGPDLPAAGEGISIAGAWNGTPVYMAPEQLRGATVDERADQFAFCVSLYEALFGKRPFEGQSQMDIVANMVEGKILEPPRGSDVPGWVRRIVLTGLSASPADRFGSVGELRRALERDPAVIRRRWVLAGAMAALVAVGTFAIHETSQRRRRELERRIGALESEYERAAGEARAARGEASTARRAALALFDEGKREAGDHAWVHVLAEEASADAAFERAEGALRAEWELDRDRPGLNERLVDVIFDRARLAEGQARGDDVAKRLAELAPIDIAGRGTARWNAPGTVALRGLDPAWRLTLQEQVRAADWSWKRRPADWSIPGGGPIFAQLPPGSYRLLIATSRGETLFLPFIVRRGERTPLDLTPAARTAVPRGFRLVLGGPTLVGERDETMRRGFCQTVPLHEVTVAPFMIAENETTNAEWITYLDSLRGSEREARRPLVSTVQGFSELRQKGGAWTFAMRPTLRLYEAGGTKIHYQGRDRLTEQNWRRFPVAGVSAGNAEAYAAWLSATGRVAGARLCTEVEWERAARGADGRPYPMGEHLGATDANFDQTYSRVSDAFGPDEVGMHAASNSPFGVADLAGNVWEIVKPSFGAEPFVLRGGGYFHDDASARSSNRQALDASARAAYVGVRICASVPSTAAPPGP